MLHSIVIPVYNEAQGIQELFRRVSQVANLLPDSCEIILVNDGSTDGTAELLNAIHRQDPRFKVLHLSRNFGHQIAISAGIHWAKGNTVTVMDADLQDPPEVIPRFLEKWRQGYEVVYGVRTQRNGETF